MLPGVFIEQVFCARRAKQIERQLRQRRCSRAEKRIYNKIFGVPLWGLHTQRRTHAYMHTFQELSNPRPKTIRWKTYQISQIGVATVFLHAQHYICFSTIFDLIGCSYIYIFKLIDSEKCFWITVSFCKLKKNNLFDVYLHEHLAALCGGKLSQLFRHRHAHYARPIFPLHRATRRMSNRQLLSVRRNIFESVIRHSYDDDNGPTHNQILSLSQKTRGRGQK